MVPGAAARFGSTDVTHASRLRELARGPAILQAPGVYDALSALLVERAGFLVAFVSGASVAFTRFGKPDLGLVDMSEMAQTVAVIRERVSIALLVDADTGFGNALNVQRTVREFERAGASAIQLEDQLSPKRCGHMQGKRVISTREMVGKVKAALDARLAGDTMIVARTDALTVEGIEAALDRASAYLEAGADALFIEGPTARSQMDAIAQRFARRAPLIHNLVEGGRSPVQTSAELEELGFRVALHPAMLVHLFAKAAPGALERLAREGGTASFRDQLLDLDAMNSLLGASAMLAQGERYA